jgi:N-methylhydantoinase A/oxoprolinase/acetone carboxylase beta subunit
VQVLRQATSDGGIRGFLFAQIGDGEVRKSLAAVMSDPLLESTTISRSAVIAHVVLCAFTPLGIERGVLEIAKELGMSPGTTHRYIRSLVALGLVEQTVDSRKYRLAFGGAASAETTGTDVSS